MRLRKRVHCGVIALMTLLASPGASAGGPSVHSIRAPQAPQAPHATQATQATQANEAAGMAAAPCLTGSDWLNGRDWIADRADNICGLSQLNQLTSPCVIDYDDVLGATPQMTRIRNEGIDPTSALGIRLKADAVQLVAEKCELVRQANGHCSVWKRIRHKDGRSIPDISSDVKALF